MTALVDVKLNTLVYNWAKNRPNKVINHISPSQLGGCMRAHYFAIKHVQQTTPPNPGAILNFEVGNLWEKPIEEAIKQSGMDYKAQWFIEDDQLNVAGTLDFALHDTEADTWEVIDSKTESVFAAKYRKFQHKDFLEASEQYVIQVGTYILLLRRKGFTVPRGRFLVITKDNGMMNEYFVTFDQALEDKIYDRIAKLNYALDNNRVPECECEGWKINYCNYGQPSTQVKNSTKKVVSSHCCADTIEEQEAWAKEEFNILEETING